MTQIKQILSDILSGVNDFDLIRKYELTPETFRKLVDRLVALGLIQEIKAQEFADDLAHGFNTRQLMQKFQISSGCVRRLSEQIRDVCALQDKIFRTRIKSSIKICVERVVADLRSGLSGPDLMARYALSKKNCLRLFQKLFESGKINRSEYLLYSARLGGCLSEIRCRNPVRYYPLITLSASVIDDPNFDGVVRDITESGVGIRGIGPEPGSKLKILFCSDTCLDFKPFLVEAVCKWSNLARLKSNITSGFMITDIGDYSLEHLRYFIEAATVSFLGSPESDPVSVKSTESIDTK